MSGLSAPRLLLIDNYDSFTYNLVHGLMDAGADVNVVRNDSLTVHEALVRRHDGIVLSPGPCTPAEAGICIDLLKQAPLDLPIFGVCLGHQALGQAHGGTVVQAQAITHGKTSKVTHTGHALFHGIDSPFEAARYHSLAVRRSDLPASFAVLAQTSDGEIMAMHRLGSLHFGVQFHPESVGTAAGPTMLNNFLAMVRTVISKRIEHVNG
jgi:anthranilate synthase component 2